MNIFFLKQELGSTLNIYHLKKIVSTISTMEIFSISDNMEMNDLLNYINSNEIYIRELYEGRKFDLYSEKLFLNNWTKFTNFYSESGKKKV